jgi:hypothetical protein
MGEGGGVLRHSEDPVPLAIDRPAWLELLLFLEAVELSRRITLEIFHDQPAAAQAAS